MKTLSKGLDKEKVRIISELKGEPEWMTKFRLNSYDIFETSLKQILASSYYQSIINGFNENKCIAQLCQKCTYRNRFR